LFAIVSAKLFGAGRVMAVDTIPSRLEMARSLGAEVIDYNAEDPVGTILRLTDGIGVDRAIDAVGVDANRAHEGPAKPDRKERKEDEELVKQVAPKTNEDDDNWHPGDAPSQVLTWAVMALAKAGTLSIIGVYPPQMRSFPIGMAMMRNLTLKMGNCPHRRYIPELIEMVARGDVNPLSILTQRQPLTSVMEAYKAFDRRMPGWVKVELAPASIPLKQAA
jgi:threonine dehydrogenase-like Zn-dependent dehydrogenase